MNFVGAVRAPRGRSRASAVAVRLLAAADVVTGALYVAFAAGAVHVLAQPAARGGRLLEALTRRLFEVTGGRLLLGVAAVIVVLSGVALSARAFSGEFAARLDRRSLSPEFLRLVDHLARAGTLARGLVFVLCGALAVWSAVDASPSRVGDVGDALAAVAATAFGPVVLAVVGVCFCGYGAYQIVKVRWRVLGFARDESPGEAS